MGRSKKSPDAEESKPSMPSKGMGSRQWSCSELEDGNKGLLKAKNEVDDEADQKIKDPLISIIVFFKLGHI